MKKTLTIIVTSIMCSVSLFSQETGHISSSNSSGDVKISSSTLSESGKMKYSSSSLMERLLGLSAKNDSVTFTVPRVAEFGEWAGERVMYYGSPFMTPFGMGINRSGTILSLRGGVMVGSSSVKDHPFLITSTGSTIGFAKTFDRLVLNANFSATNYAGDFGSINQFGFSGLARYAISDRFSFTIYGQMFDKTPIMSMAMYPYVTYNQFGGYVSYRGDVLGLDLGVEQYFDPYSHTWEVAPIVVPKIRISDSVTVEVSVGRAIKSGLDRSQMRNQPPPPPPAPRKKK